MELSVLNNYVHIQNHTVVTIYYKHYSYTTKTTIAIATIIATVQLLLLSILMLMLIQQVHTAMYYNAVNYKVM